MCHAQGCNAQFILVMLLAIPYKLIISKEGFLLHSGDGDTGMKKVATLLVVALGLSACASTSGPQANASMDWGNISGAQVAKVNNIKSLISPGVY
jgi:hypothetical protein